MDSFTHIVLGACIGEVIAGRKLGKKAMLIGAIANSLPDIDIVASAWLGTTADLLAHRGITHSFFFLAIVSPVLAWICTAIFRRYSMSFSRWVFFWMLEIFMHLFIDAFTAYGTGWFEPFSHYRVSFNTMFVLDPLFTIGPMIAFFVLLVLKERSNQRMKWARAGLVICAAYTLFSVVNKAVINNNAEQAFSEKHIIPHRYFTTPTPLNNLLWYVVAETDSGFYAGYRSILDKQEGIQFHYLYRNDTLLKEAKNKSDLNNLLRFSKGFYTAQLRDDSLIFNDLRLGEIYSDSATNPKFVFYFYLQHPEANDLIVQRGRMAMMNKATFGHFLSRMIGK